MNRLPSSSDLLLQWPPQHLAFNVSQFPSLSGNTSALSSICDTPFLPLNHLVQQQHSPALQGNQLQQQQQQQQIRAVNQPLNPSNNNKNSNSIDSNTLPLPSINSNNNSSTSNCLNPVSPNKNLSSQQNSNKQNLLVPSSSSIQQQNRCSSVHSTSCTPPPTLKTQSALLQNRNQSLNLMSQHQMHHDIRSGSPATFNNRTLTPTPNANNNNNDSFSHTCKRPRLALSQEDENTSNTWITSNHT